MEYKVNNLTHFRKDFINIVNMIPFGQTLTYGEIAKMLAEKNESKECLFRLLVGLLVGIRFA